MHRRLTSRAPYTILGIRLGAVLCFGLILASGLGTAPGVAQSMQPRHTPAPIERRTPPAEHPGGNGHRGMQQQHLAQWMDAHRGLPLEQQQNALGAEPGFRQLQPQVQQRMRDRLTELNAMSPEQRQRVLSRTEAMEQLSPPQRQEVRGAMQQLGSLPDDRRHAVARSFRVLRDVPPSQQQETLNSPQFRSQFNDQERGTLTNLLKVAPLLPSPPPPASPR